ncbi:MAG: hypothetical protein AAF968_07385 [Pseudomonadota bacterium]
MIKLFLVRCWLAGVAFVLAVVLLTEVATARNGLDPRPVAVSIPIRPLAEAIVAFNDQTGVRIVAAAEVVAGVSSAPVDAILSPAAAVSTMLVGTGLD